MRENKPPEATRIGQEAAQPATPGVDGFYVAVMLPGIIALSALGGAIEGGSVWLTERLRGVVKEHLAAPIPRISILKGNALSAVAKSLIQAVVILIVGLLMGVRLTVLFRRVVTPAVR